MSKSSTGPAPTSGPTSPEGDASGSAADGAGHELAHLIRARGLHKRFGGENGIWAVRGIDLDVPAGQVLGFLGPNGAGKSTTMRMITGFLAPTQGTVSICGIDLASDPIAAKRAIGYLPEGAPAYPDMTVAEFLRFIAEARGYRGSERDGRVDDAIRRVNLGSVRGQSIETLSKGYKRRTGLAQAMLHDPKILVLDEPTDGLDPNQKHEVRELIRQLGGDRAIVLSTHILEEVEAVCTRAVIINRGQIVFDGTPAAMEAKAPAAVSRNRLDWVFRELTTGDVPNSSSKSAGSRKEVA
ncbi:MAG: ABC transporter ATP-binding protein [Phycisphaerae bacterium]|nr:ABC transporter ATP-binding protein [Phycisphaerae bacterium]